MVLIKAFACEISPKLPFSKTALCNIVHYILFFKCQKVPKKKKKLYDFFHHFQSFLPFLKPNSTATYI